MLIGATIIGELFMLLSWTHNSVIDEHDIFRTVQNLENKIEIGKNWLATSSKLPGEFTLDFSDSNVKLSFDMTKHASKDRDIRSDYNGDLYIYNLNFEIQNAGSISDTEAQKNRQYYIEKFVAPMSKDIYGEVYLMRAAYTGNNPNSAEHRVIVESIVSRDKYNPSNPSDPANIHEIMRQEIWY